jgi:hypothetical protein
LGKLTEELRPSYSGSEAGKEKMVEEKSQRLEPPDVSCFNENFNKFPQEQLEPFYGLYVAWSPDGTRILASGESLEEVDEKLKAAGIHFSQVVHSFIDPPL